MTTLIRKYYNQPISFDHRRNWPQKEKQKSEQRVESQNQDLNLSLNQNLDQDQSQSPNQNLKPRKNHLVDMQLAFLEEQKL